MKTINVLRTIHTAQAEAQFEVDRAARAVKAAEDALTAARIRRDALLRAMNQVMDPDLTVEVAEPTTIGEALEAPTTELNAALDAALR